MPGGTDLPATAVINKNIAAKGKSSMDSSACLSPAHFLWALGTLCRLHRLPFDPKLLLQQFAPPHGLPAVSHAARALGFEVATEPAVPRVLAGLGLPALVFLTPCPTEKANAEGLAPAASGNSDSASRFAKPAFLIEYDAERVTVLHPDSAAPEIVPATALAKSLTGEVLVFGRSPEAPADPDAAPAPGRFGFRWFIPELLKHKRTWRDVLAASLAIQLMALATPLFTQAIIDKVIVHHTTSTLIVIGIALAVFMAFTAGMSWVRQYLVLHAGNRIDAVLASQVFRHLLHLPARYFEHRSTGVLIARVHAVETVREFLSGAVVMLFLDFPFLLIFLGVMLWYSVTLSLIAVAILGAIVALSFAVTPALRKRLNHQFLVGARNQAFLTEYVSGIDTVKSLQMEPQLTSRFDRYLADYLQASFGTRQLANGYNVAANALEHLLTLAILCLGAWMVMENQAMTIGMLVAFQMFASRLSQPMLRLAGLWQDFQQSAIAVKRLGDVMNAPPEPHSLIPVRASIGRGAIEIRDLGFRYAENLPWLYRGFNLTIRPGQCLALMGPSGSGKSTLAKLLQAFYFPTEGAVLLDGRNVRHLGANELRAHFGVVPQETVLFSGTLYENLVLANPYANFEQVVHACRMAEIHETIEQLPQGYQTRIGEHGVGLSGGQKQRIAIARALLKRPKILIFDEATSSLDPATAEHFARTVNGLKGKVTLLFVAHLLPKGLQVDAVVRLNGAGSKIEVVEGERKDS